MSQISAEQKRALYQAMRKDGSIKTLQDALQELSEFGPSLQLVEVVSTDNHGEQRVWD